MSELDLKKEILKELGILIQIASPDFVLIPPYNRFSADSEHRAVDLLFYYRNMQCLIPVYLKFGDLHTDDVEWMKVNLQALDEYNIQQDDGKPVGIILCVQDNKEHTELVQLEENNGWVYKYTIMLPLRKIFAGLLRDSVKHAREELASGKFMRWYNEH